MNRSRPALLLALGLVTAPIVFLGARILASSGYYNLFFGYFIALPILVLAAVLWLLGRAVADLKAGKKTSLTPIGAAFVAAGALAGSHGSSLLVGVFTGLCVHAWIDYSDEVRWVLLGPDLAALVSCTVLLIVSLWVENICAIDDGEDQIHKKITA